MAYRWLALLATAALALSACSTGSGAPTTQPSASAPSLTTAMPVSAPGSQLASIAPIASAGPPASAAGSAVPIGRDQAIAIARRFAVGTNGVVQADAGPFQQFDPAPPAKISPPPPDHLVWRVRFVGPISTSFVILDYCTGQYIEAGVATP